MTQGYPTRRLRIPVRFVDGIWECALGGPVPLKNDTEAQLVVQRTSISDEAFLEIMERQGRHKVLDEGTSLLFCMTIKPENPVPETLRPFIKTYDDFRNKISTTYLDYWNPNTIRFVEVKLAGPNSKQSRLFGSNRGGLWLLTEGVEAVGLSSTTISVPPEVSRTPVVSLNHAYTVLSEKFETWRISHTGNIYTRVLYQEQNGTWYPLDTLRNKALDKQEQEIAKKIWEDFITKMSSTP